MPDYIAQEEVDFQIGSTLFKELAKASQDLLDKIAALGPNPTQVRLEKTIIASSFYEDIRSAISKHLGYNLSNLYIVRSPAPIAGIINTISGKYKINVEHDLRKLGTGLTNKGSPSFRVKEGLAKISDATNEDTGKIDDSVKNKVIARLVLATGIFTFLNPINDRLSAEELAALLLHEIGHVVDTAHICGWFYYRSTIVGAVLDTFDTNTVSQEELKEILETLTKVAHTFPYTEDTRKLLATIEKAQAIVDGDISPTQLGKVEQAVKVATASVMATLVAKRDASIIEKYSDLVVTKNNEAYRERTADAFAVKYGAGAPLASVLKKLATYTEGGTEIIRTQNASPLVQACIFWYNASLSLREILKFSVCDITDGYDGTLDRLQRTIDTQKQIFRKDLPPDLRDFYLDEVKKMESEIATYFSASHVKTREAVYSALSKFFSIVSDVFSLGSSNTVEKDYRSLFNLTEALIKSPLHYELARARRLLKK